MTDRHEPIRSYQRIFRPERRIYQIEGRSLPVPGGIPLRWLGYATGALVAVLALSSRSITIGLLVAVVGGAAGLAAGGRSAGALTAIGAFAGFWAGVAIVNFLDWPLRLIVMPVAVATLATQATPDGRRADRFAASWLNLRIAPRRRSLGRALPPTGVGQVGEAAVWVAPDEHAPEIRRGRIEGPATVTFGAKVRVRRFGLRQRRMRARPARGRTPRRELLTRKLAVGVGEVLEVRP